MNPPETKFENIFIISPIFLYCPGVQSGVFDVHGDSDSRDWINLWNEYVFKEGINLFVFSETLDLGRYSTDNRLCGNNGNFGDLALANYVIKIPFSCLEYSENVVKIFEKSKNRICLC